MTSTAVSSVAPVAPVVPLPDDVPPQPEQRRILCTALPGPRSRALQQRRDAALPGGLGVTLPVFVDRAGGGILVSARRIERIVRDRLEPLAAECPAVAEVRGRGAMVAVELVRPGTLEPDPDLAREVAARCHAEGVVTLVCGTYGNVIRLLPPLVIFEDLLTDGLDVLAAAIRSAS